MVYVLSSLELVLIVCLDHLLSDFRVENVYDRVC